MDPASTMKPSLRNLIIFSSIYLCSSTAWSHDHTENRFYIGVKAGALLADKPKIDSTNTLGLQLEYHFTPNLAIEADYLKGNSEDIPTDDTNMESLAVYGVLRSKNTCYALLKVGFEGDLGTSSILNQKGISLSAGIGAGVILNRRFSIESEYTLINENLTYLGLSFRYGF